MTLSNDPKKALRQIAELLQKIQSTTDREVYKGERENILGYWQTKELTSELLDAANECNRVADEVENFRFP